MQLRNHPLVSYKGSRYWPPRWILAGEFIGGPTGEIGVLTGTIIPSAEPENRCILIVDYESATYFGILHFDDRDFRNKIGDLLYACRGRTIREVGDVELYDLN